LSKCLLLNALEQYTLEQYKDRGPHLGPFSVIVVQHTFVCVCTLLSGQLCDGWCSASGLGNINLLSSCAGAVGALLPPDGNWTLALQDMRLSMNVTSGGNSRKDIFALQSINSTFTRCVCRSDTMRCNIVAAVNFDISACLAQASCVKG